MKKARKPFGRMKEYLATLSDEERSRTAVKAGRIIGDDDTAQTWNCREAMARTIRMQEKSSPRSEWSPVVPLAGNEGR